MPTSRPYHLTWLCNKVIELKPRRILDIGIGYGTKGMLFREYTDVWNGDMFDGKVVIDGVEIFEKYITDIQRKIYNNIYIGNIIDLIDTLPCYDLIYMGDVLEHIERSKGMSLLKKLKGKARDLIIVTPAKVSHQGAVYENENETHVSQWYTLDFEGFNILEIENSLIAHYSKPQVYYCEGMKFYGERMMTVFGLKQYTNTGDETLFMGLYFDEDYRVFSSHKGRKIVFWNGSDVSKLEGKKSWQKVVNDIPATHYCHNELLQKELGAMGITAKVEPIFFADMNDYPVKFASSDKLEIYITAHPEREAEYGVPEVVQLAQRLPSAEVYIYGVDGPSRDNIHYMGWIEESKMDELASRHQIFLRLNEHDGLSQQLIKACLWGQYVLTVQDVIGTTKVTKEAIEIERVMNSLEYPLKPQLSARDALLQSNLNHLTWLQNL